MSHPLAYLPFYPAASQRTLRQFIEAFWNEGCLQGAIAQRADGQSVLRLTGSGADGQARLYDIDIAGHSAFDRLRLGGAVRPADANAPTATVSPAAAAYDGASIAVIANDLLRHVQAPAQALCQFITELQHTALKQAWSMTVTPEATLDSPYPLQEAQLGDGHLYHPCFRSRMGFSIDEHLQYGPEFARPLELVWLAIARDASAVHAVDGIDYERFLREQLGESEYRWLLGQIEAQGQTPSRYRLLPVHPWQWAHCIALHYADWLGDATLLLLGRGQGEWLAQQSIRSLSSLDVLQGGHRCNIKLPLAIANSSADRILSDHHVHNAPLISAWLRDICRRDPFLEDGKLAILAEPVGITLAADRQRPGAYGLLGAIWRTAPESVLASDEQVLPMTALTTGTADTLTIAPWLERHGCAAWVHALLEAAVPPLLHLMMAHGVLLECHAQNTLLIVRDGLPRRIALRDLPGGLHYLPGATNAAQLDGLRAAPAWRNALNASAGFFFQSDGEARDYLLEVLFFINLGELAWRLACHHGYPEAQFWQAAAGVVQAYQARFPAMAQRHSQFDLFGAELRIECLATRRLLGGGTQRLRVVRNPLAPLSCTSMATQ